MTSSCFTWLTTKKSQYNWRSRYLDYYYTTTLSGECTYGKLHKLAQNHVLKYLNLANFSLLMHLQDASSASILILLPKK